MSSNIGERIRQLRKEKGFTQKQLGDLCSMADSAIRRYESGRQNPKKETLQKIASALGVLPGDLLQDGFYPTSQEIDAMKRGAASVTDERRLEIEEKRLSNLIDRKKKMLNISGKRRAAAYMDVLSKIPEYRTDKE